ncbi:MAG: hypothetical protein CXZ00_16575 [Acidobacteria bacterium]|nr:MAG: hypothetical protein CXZ00_16575 [Acidobacteriota bacterium]
MNDAKASPIALTSWSHKSPALQSANKNPPAPAAESVIVSTMPFPCNVVMIAGAAAHTATPQTRSTNLAEIPVLEIRDAHHKLMPVSQACAVTLANAAPIQQNQAPDHERKSRNSRREVWFGFRNRSSRALRRIIEEYAA